jgi:hypothetical protein
MEWLALLVVIPAAWLQLLLHEGAHAVAARILGCTVTAFVPWPHVLGRDFYFGRVSWRYPTDPPLTDDQRAHKRHVIALAPTFVSLVLLIALVLTSLALRLAEIQSIAAHAVLWSFGLCASVDLGRNLLYRWFGGARRDINKTRLPDAFVALLLAHVVLSFLIMTLGLIWRPV